MTPLFGRRLQGPVGVSADGIRVIDVYYSTVAQTSTGFEKDSAGGELFGVFAFLGEVTVPCSMVVMSRVGNQGTLEIRI